MLPVLALTCLLWANGPLQDDLDHELVLREYAEAVSDLVQANALDPAQLEVAQEVISRLVRTGAARALVRIASDAASTAERLLELTIEREGAQVTLEAVRAKLSKMSGAAREAAEAEVQRLEKRDAVLKGLLPPLHELRVALHEALLEITEKSANLEPEAAFKLLVAYFKEDSESHYALDLKVRQLKAGLASLSERLASTKEADDRTGLERKIARAGADLAVRSVDLERLEALRERRIQTLARLFGALKKGLQGRELKRIRANLRDDVAWQVRAVHVELLGHIPVPEAVGTIISVMKHAAKQRRQAGDQLEDLRVAYARALAALLGSLKGGNGMVPTSVVANKNKAERVLRGVSRQEYGEARVLEAAAKALGNALGGLGADERSDKLTVVLKLASQDSSSDVRTRAIEALGKLADDRVVELLASTLEKSGSLRLRLAALDALVAQQTEHVVEICITTLLKDREWRIRAAAMRALAAIPRKQAVPALIQSVSVETGRLIDDAEQALFALTGRSFNGDAFLWKDWWSKNKDTFRVGSPAHPGDASAKEKPAWRSQPGHVSFYGISTRSNRILFVLDRSGSMNDPIGDSDTGAGAQRKIDAAKQQLKAAIAGLENGDLFNIITYAVDVVPWQRRMVKRTAKVAKKVNRYIDREIQAASGTNIHDALRDAFRVAGIGAMDKAYESNVDTIFFLTDGMPSVGEVQDPEQILLRVREWNRLARIVVHTVGVGKDHDASFLRRLAEENGGQYTSR